jgi:hypothetical protein
MIVANVAYDATVVLDGTSIIVGGTNRHLADQWTRGTLKLRNVNFSGTLGAQAGVYSVVTPSAAKKLSIVGGTFTLTASASNTPAILIERAAGSSTAEWVEVRGAIITVTVPGAAYGVGIRLNRITSGTNLDGDTTPPIVEQNTVSITSSGTTNDSYGIVSSSTDATAVADNTVIRNNIVTCNSPAARCVTIGLDGTTAYFAANALIVGNTVTNPFYNGVATPHGIHCGRVTNCSAIGNRVNGFAVGVMCSIGMTCLATGNVVVGAYYAPLFAKGNTSATFANNTVLMDDTLYGAVFGGYACLGVAVQGATNNVATLFQNNLCYVRNGTNWKYTDVDASQVANFEGNNYYADEGVTLTNPWSYQGSTDATLAAWNTRATVGTDADMKPWVLTNPLP